MISRHVVRWLLFLPASLVTGIGLFLLFGLGSMNAAAYFDEDVAVQSAFVGGIIAGSCSVYTAMKVAPGCPRTAAGLSGIGCVALASFLVFWTRASHQDEAFVSTIIAGATYSFGALVTAMVFIFRLDQKKRT